MKTHGCFSFLFWFKLSYMIFSSILQSLNPEQTYPVLSIMDSTCPVFLIEIRTWKWSVAVKSTTHLVMGWRYSYPHHHHLITSPFLVSLAIFPLRTVGILLVLTGHSLCCREIYIKGEVVWTQTDVWVRTQTGPAGHCPGCTFLNSRWVLRICVSPAWNYSLTTALWPNPRHMAPQDCFQKIIWLELNYFQ